LAISGIEKAALMGGLGQVFHFKLSMWARWMGKPTALLAAGLSDHALRGHRNHLMAGDNEMVQQPHVHGVQGSLQPRRDCPI